MGRFLAMIAGFLALLGLANSARPPRKDGENTAEAGVQPAEPEKQPAEKDAPHPTEEKTDSPLPPIGKDSAGEKAETPPLEAEKEEATKSQEQKNALLTVGDAGESGYKTTSPPSPIGEPPTEETPPLETEKEEAKEIAASLPTPDAPLTDGENTLPAPNAPDEEIPPLPPSESQEKPEETPPPELEESPAKTEGLSEQPQTMDAPTDETEAIAPPAPPKKVTSGEPKPPPKPRGKTLNDGGKSPRLSPEPDKYELTCRRTGGEWNLFIRLLQPGREGGFAKKFSQNNVPLVFKGSDCKLTDYSLPVECEGEKVDFQVGGKYIFRLKDGQERGKSANRISRRGLYLVIAPEGYKRINSSPPFSPESCADGNFQAHFFLGGDGERNDGFEGETNSFIRSKFSLEREKIYDNKEEDLFLSPPELVAEGGGAPEWLAVENETIGRDWNPFKFSGGGDIAKEIRGETGAFSVRIYDNRPKMQERIFFRVTSELKKILINGVEYSRELVIFPPASGHGASEICFIGGGGENLRPKLKTESRLVNERKDGVFEVQPHSAEDCFQWVIQEENGDVEIDIALPRVWWRIGKDGEWRDTSLKMTPEEFSAIEGDMEISVPSGVRYLMVGNKGNVNMKIPAIRCKENRARSLVTIKMLDITGHIQAGSQTTVLQAACGEKILSFLAIKSDIMPKPFDFPVEPMGKGGSGWKRAKGFSCGEIREAGFSVSDARAQKLKIDFRRQSSHCRNVKILKGEQ